MNPAPEALAPYAAHEEHSRGRRFKEPPPSYRGEYQRDRDRIIHSTGFRRLVYKTQVFVNHEGDLYRTRLTHSLEVAQIARTAARALHLNEALVEAISLAHDLGRAAILLVNKWDTIEKDNATAGATVKQIREAMPFLRYAEVQLVSALTGQRLQRILPCVDQAIEQHRRRIPTAALNQLLERILQRTPPPSRHGRMSKIYYWTQADTAPPTFILLTSSVAHS